VPILDAAKDVVTDTATGEPMCPVPAVCAACRGCLSVIGCSVSR
jgi:hypothetical protein